MSDWVRLCLPADLISKAPDHSGAFLLWLGIICSREIPYVTVWKVPAGVGKPAAEHASQ